MTLHASSIRAAAAAALAGVLCLVQPASAQVRVVVTGTVVDLYGPGLTDPVLSQLSLGDTVVIVYEAGIVGSPGNGGTAYPVDTASSSAIAAGVTVPAVAAGGMNVVELGDDPAGDTVYGEVELPGDGSAVFLLLDLTGAALPSEDLAPLVGTTVVPGPLTYLVAEIVDDLTSVDLLVTSMVFEPGQTEVGTGYCVAAVNSGGTVGAIRATGSETAASNDFTLRASDLPLGQFGIFLVSRTQGFLPGVGGTSDGNLCLAGSIGRFAATSQILGTGTSGAFSLRVDLDSIPQGPGLVSIAPGETWNFQAWHRDATALGSNLTNGVQVDFN